MARTYRMRKTVDLTAAQAEVLDEMMRQADERASDAAGVKIRLGTRRFFHMLLKKHADELGLDWPEDYPTPGGWRGGRKAERDEEDDS